MGRAHDSGAKTTTKSECSEQGERSAVEVSFRSRVPMLGYLFFVADRTKTTLGYRGEDSSEDEWCAHECSCSHFITC